ncbi:hypothetical protein ANCCAN_08576, partial [Ancylostoma caninum]
CSLGDWSRGFRGIAALPNFKKEFQESIGTAIQYAKTLKCDKVHVMAGIPANSDGDVSKVFLENVSYAAAKLGEANLMCLIEPINHCTIPGYFLSSYEQAKAVIDAVKLPNLKIQYVRFKNVVLCVTGTKSANYFSQEIKRSEVFVSSSTLKAISKIKLHRLIAERLETVSRTYSMLSRFVDRFRRVYKSIKSLLVSLQIGLWSVYKLKPTSRSGYIQVAQVPSRNEPITSGEIDYKYVFGLLQSTNPNWTIGLEHNFHEAHGAPRDWVRDLGLTM